MHRLRLRWCRFAHPRIRYAGGPTYQCATCLMVHEVPHRVLPVIQMHLPQPKSVRQVYPLKLVRKVSGE